MKILNFIIAVVKAIVAFFVAGLIATNFSFDAGIPVGCIVGGIVFFAQILTGSQDDDEQPSFENDTYNSYDEQERINKDMAEHPYSYDLSDEETFYKVGAQVIAAQQRAQDEAKAQHLSDEETRKKMYEAGKEQEDYIKNIMKGL